MDRLSEAVAILGLTHNTAAWIKGETDSDSYTFYVTASAIKAF